MILNKAMGKFLKSNLISKTIFKLLVGKNELDCYNINT